MEILFPFLIIVTAGLIFTELSSRFHVPYVTALIVAGIIFGPSVFGIVENTPEINFLGNIGVIFLMFLAGSAIDLKGLRKSRRDVAVAASTNSIIPFLTGLGLTYALTQNWEISILIGVIFISSAIAVIIPTIESLKLTNTRLGNSIITTTVIEDLASLTLLAIFIQQASEENIQVILLSLIAIILLLSFMRRFLNRLINWIDEYEKKRNQYESRVRFVLVILFATVVLFGLLGLNAIIASFVAGILVGDYINRTKLHEKIRTIAYGIFIPVFFFMIGVQTELTSLFTGQTLIITCVIVLGLIISKVISGFIAGKAIGFSNNQSLFFGFATIPQLSTTLAVVFTAAEAELIPQDFVTAVVILTIITATISPFLLNYLGERLSKRTKNTRREKVEQSESVFTEMV